MILSKKLISEFVQRIGQPTASVLLHNFFNSYSKHFHSQDVKDLYDEPYFEKINELPTYKMINDRYKIHIYSQYAYEYIVNHGAYQAKVLDVGCGTGDFSLALSFSGFDVIGIDFSSLAIEAANRRIDAYTQKCSFICGDVGDLEIKEPFDFVVLNDITEHLSDYELDRLLGKLLPLVPAGEIIIHTPNGLALCNDTDTNISQRLYKAYLMLCRNWRGHQREVDQIFYDQLHINIKSYKQLKALLEKHGLKTKVYYDEQRTFFEDLSCNMLVTAKKR